MKKNLFLIFCGIILFTIISCVTDDHSSTKNTDIENSTNKGKFTVFYRDSRSQSRGANTIVNYPKGFAILMQKYDSVQKTNLTGLVNSNNTTVNDEKLRQNFILNAVEPYVETRIFSEPIIDDEGNLSVFYPKILDDKVVDVFIAQLSEEETQVHYYLLDKNSFLYNSSIKLFQEDYNLTFRKGNTSTKSSRNGNGGFDCGYGSLPACNLDPVIINPGNGNPPIGGGGGIDWGPEMGGGGCKPHEMCQPPEQNGGGGNNGSGDPCEEAKNENEKSSKLLNEEKIKNRITEMTESIATNKKEKGFSFGIKSNGEYIVSSLMEGTEDNIQLPANATTGSNYYTILGSAHTHPADGFESFSVSDIYLFAQNHQANIDYRNIFVYGAGGGIYSLSIVDRAKFLDFTANYPKSDYYDAVIGWKENSSISIEFKKAFENFYENQKLSDNESFDLAMAHVLNKFNTGVALNKRDANGKFNPLFVNGNSENSTYSKSTDCNLKKGKYEK